MFPDLPSIQAGHTVTHPAFAQRQLPVQAVVTEVFLVQKTKKAELANGLFLPLSELQQVETGEQWAAIAGYEHYRISSHGKVVSVFYNGQPRQRLLKLLNSSRYPEIRLGKKSAYLRIGLNRLVAQTFLPPPAEERLTVVIPKDGNRLNMSVENLQWVDPNELTDEAVWRHLRGYRTRTHSCKLKAADIAQIRVLAAQGLTTQEIARQFDVSRPAISVLLSSTTRRLNE